MTVVEANSHAEHTVLQVARAITKLQERERHPKRNERVNKQPGEDVVGRPPEFCIVTLNDVAQLVPEGSSVWTFKAN